MHTIFPSFAYISFLDLFHSPLGSEHFVITGSPGRVLTQLRSLRAVHSADVVTLLGARVVVHEGEAVGAHLLGEHVVHTLIVLVTLAGVGEEAVRQRTLRHELLLRRRGRPGSWRRRRTPLALGCGKKTIFRKRKRRWRKKTNNDYGGKRLGVKIKSKNRKQLILI